MLKNCSKADLKVIATELGLAFDKKVTIVQLLDLIQKSNYYKKDIEFVERLVNSTIEERKHLEEIALEKAKAEQGQMNLEQIKLERVKAELELARLRSESNSENKNENSGENDKKESIESLDSLIKSIRTLTVKLPNRPEGFTYFFSSLERAFISKNVPEKFKAEILLNLLGEKASNVITYIKDDELGDYSKVKAIVLREFEPTPQVSLENFRKTQRQTNETYMQFASRLTTSWDYYLKLRNVSDFETLKKLVVSDKICQTLDKEVMCFISVRQNNSWFQPIELAKEIDLYYTSKGKPVINDSRPSNKNSYPKHVSKVFLTDVKDSKCILSCDEIHPLYKCPIYKNMSVSERVEFVKSNSLCFNCLEKGNHRANNCRSKFLCGICKKKHHISLHYPRQPKTNKETISQNMSNQSKSIHSALNASAPIFEPSQENSLFQTSCNLANDLKSVLLSTFFCLIKDESGAEYFYELLKPGQISLHDTNLRLQNSVFGYIVSGSLLAKGEAEIHCGLITDNSELEKTLKEFWEIENIERESEISVTKEAEICEEHFLKNYSRTETGKFMVKMPFKEDPSCLGESRKKAEKCLNSLWTRLRREPKLCELYKIFMQEYLHMGHMEEVIEYEEPDVNYYIPHHCVFRPESNTTPLRVVYNASALTSSGKSLNCIQFNGGTIQDDLLSIMLRFRKHKFAFVADIKKMYRMILIDPNQRDLLRILFKAEVNDPVKVYKLCTVTYGTTSAPFLATRTVQQLAKDEGKDFPLASSVLQDVYMDDVLTGEDNLIKAKDMQQQLISLFDRGGMELHKWSANNQSLLCDEMKGSDYSFSKETKTLGILWKPQPDCFGFNLIIEQSEVYTKRAVLSQIARIFDPLGLLGPIITKAKIFLQKLWLLKLDWGDTLPLKENTEWQSFLNSLKFVNLINVPRWILSEQCISVELHGFADASEVAYGAVIYVKSINSYGGSEVKLLISKSRVAPLKFVTIPRLELCAAVLLSKLMRRVLRALKLEVSKSYFWTDSTIVLSWLEKECKDLKTFVANRISIIRTLTVAEQWNHVPSKQNPADLISRGMDPVKLQLCELWWSPSFLLQPEMTKCRDSSIETNDLYIRELKSNPSDLLSRGHKAESLLHHEGWWNGPSVLQSDELPETVCECSDPDEDYLPELKSKNSKADIVLTLNSNKTFFDYIVNRSNRILTVVRILSFLFRFISNCRNPESKRKGPLTSEELSEAEHYLIKQCQFEVFSAEVSAMMSGDNISNKSKILNLSPFLDNKGVMRVGGRLENSQLPYSGKHPIILPSKGKLTEMIVRYYHEKYFHLGRQHLLFQVRQKYWPIHGRNVCRKIVHNCVVCFKVKPKEYSQKMGNLPKERITPDKVFSSTGIDLCGPFLIKNKYQRKGPEIKVYVCIFICLVTKAIHLEIISDLTSQSLIATLKRFISRRGKCHKIFSDNGSNMVGANRALRDLNKLVRDRNESLYAFFAEENIEWSFIPPRSPNWGGLWEANIKAFKYHFKRVAGNSKFSYEELLTLTTQIEAILNSRPLTPLSADVDDLEVLTPAHFLIGRPITAIVEPSLIDFETNRLNVWQRITKSVQTIWKRWSLSYLNGLQQRKKWVVNNENLKIGDMVLIREENLPPCKWLMGRVIALYPGQDNKVRVVDVKTSKGIYKRSINKLSVLPIEN
ncbi:hypothetical protein AVEN_168530-1 [Araneus ventricosus]|uniref:Integrase catalytic domain-containing protein n=2 Tax=Araneus ventricosus TaxID=182803 RepID=A0A4Y2DPI7_ARAVE|nr:hypothetical protein AVEN_47617-1 [Araneus ventricosus]GBM17704.1 hypothetical protein AVEN_168530-1 [Araneus ventricosus]